MGDKPKTEITPEMAAILSRPEVTEVVVEAPEPTVKQVAEDKSQVLIQKVVIPRPDKQRHFIAAFMFSFYFGWLGIDRFYMGKYITGLIKLLTIGGLGLWVIIDTGVIVSGAAKDRWGNPLIDAAKYKKFAKTTISLTYLISLVLVILIAVSIFLAIPELQSAYGEMQQLIQMLNSNTPTSSLNY